LHAGLLFGLLLPLQVLFFLSLLLVGRHIYVIVVECSPQAFGAVVRDHVDLLATSKQDIAFTGASSAHHASSVILFSAVEGVLSLVCDGSADRPIERRDLGDVWKASRDEAELVESGLSFGWQHTVVAGLSNLRARVVLLP
jgi:hypothetical protein